MNFFPFRRSSEGDWMFDSHFSVKYFRERGAFKLESMYKQVNVFIFLKRVTKFNSHEKISERV